MDGRLKPRLHCALALSGGVAKGAFHAGVLKSFAEYDVLPTAIVGTSAGALNGAYAAKLIAEERFTPYWVERMMVDLWVQQANITKLWKEVDAGDNSLRSSMGNTRFNLFMLRHFFDWISPMRLRELLKLRFTSVLSAKHFRQQLENTLTAPRKIEREVHFAAAVTSLTGQVETYANQPLTSYGRYVSFHLTPDMESKAIEDIFETLRTVVRASSSFPAVFPPVSLKLDGKTDYFTDGGLTKNGPFGRAIKLDPQVRTIFLSSCMPITQPTSGRVDNLLTIFDQIYKVVINKDLANDFRKIQQINERIERLRTLLEKDADGEYIQNEFNQSLIELGGFKNLEDYKQKRTVEVIFIEPPLNLEGDPFAGLYRNDREKLLSHYIDMGYEAGRQCLQNYLNRPE